MVMEWRRMEEGKRRVHVCGKTRALPPVHGPLLQVRDPLLLVLLELLRERGGEEAHLLLLCLATRAHGSQLGATIALLWGGGSGVHCASGQQITRERAGESRRPGVGKEAITRGAEVWHTS